MGHRSVQRPRPKDALWLPRGGGYGVEGPWKLREGIGDILPLVVPTTDAEAIAQGWPSIAAAVSGDIWLCDETAPNNLVGEVNAIALAPQNAPLQGRRFQGMPYAGTLWSKAAVETIGGTNTRFRAANAGVLDVTTEDFTLSFLLRPKSIFVGSGGLEVVATKGVPTVGVYEVYTDGANIYLWLEDATGFTNHNCGAFGYDGALHLATFAVDRNGNISFYLDDNATVTVAAGRPNTLSNADSFTLCNYVGGSNNYAFNGQVAWLYFNIGVAATRTGHDALYSRMVQWSYPTDLFTTKTRSNRITVPVGYLPGTGQLVATYAAGQPAHAFAMGPKQAQSPLLAGTTLPLDWRQAVTQNTPPARYAAGVCYDSARRQIVLFGGRNVAGAQIDDTWIFDVTTQEWMQASSGGPSAREQMQLVYDSVRDRIVLFGGYTGAANAETYEWDGTTRQWTLMAPVASPTARYDYAATYDSTRQRVLIFGGIDGAGVLRRETYEYDGVTWTQVSNVGPTARRGAALAYEPDQARGLLFGGNDGAANGETWSWNGATATWANLAPAASPVARYDHACWYDSVRQAVYAAFGYSGAVNLQDTWSYSWTGNTWTQQAAEYVSARFYPAVAFDGYRGVALLFGGFVAAANAETWMYGRGPVGLAAAQRLTFLGIGSNDLNAWTDSGGANSHSLVDGCSGMRDAIRVVSGGVWTDGGANSVYSLLALVAATNVPWSVGFMYKRGAVGTTARASCAFVGDPAGGEYLNTLTDNASPSEWTPRSTSVMPTGAAHNQLYYCVGSSVNPNDADFSEPYLIQGSDQPAPYYLRVAGASETVAAQTTTIAGVVGKYAPPAKGQLLFNLLGAPGATERMGTVDGTIWRALEVGGLNGSFWVRCCPDFQIRILDASGYEVATLRTGYVPRAGDSLDLDAAWNSGAALPVLSALGTDHAAIMLQGQYAASGAPNPWAPAAKASITRIKVLSDN